MKVKVSHFCDLQLLSFTSRLTLQQANPQVGAVSLHILSRRLLECEVFITQLAVLIISVCSVGFCSCYFMYIQSLLPRTGVFSRMPFCKCSVFLVFFYPAETMNLSCSRGCKCFISIWLHPCPVYISMCAVFCILKHFILQRKKC